MSTEARLACYQQAVQLAVEHLFAATEGAFLESFHELQRVVDGGSLTAERLEALREQFVQLVAPSAVSEATLLLDAFGVREKLKYLDYLCEQQPPLVDGRRHLAPSKLSPLRVFRVLRLREKEHALQEMRELLAEEEFRSRQLDDEVTTLRTRLEELKRRSERPLEELNRALRALNDVPSS
jgi:hypothetical protein